MSQYQYGRLPATRPFGLQDLTSYVKGKIPAPPADVAAPEASYPIDFNDQIGDCTIAGVAHLIAAWDVEVAEKDEVPTADQVKETYFKLTGGPDSGLNEANVLQTWQSSGLFGADIAGYAPVDHRNIIELHQAVAFYGGCYLGINCPESAQEQFQAGQPWTYVPGSKIEGGHCIVALGYDANGLACATWGGIAQVTYPFLAHYLDEAWAIIPHQFVEAKKGPELDLAALQADLKSLSN